MTGNREKNSANGRQDEEVQKGAKGKAEERNAGHNPASLTL